MDLLDELLTWIEDRSFGEWVGVFSLIVAILALIIKKKIAGKKIINAEKTSVAFGDGASENTINLNANLQEAKNVKNTDR